MRFLDLELEDPVPDATTIWLFREALVEAGLIDKLFARFRQHLEAAGYLARGGQIVGAQAAQIRRRRTRRSRSARRWRDGSSNLPRMPRRTRTRAGRKGTTRACTATTTMSGWKA